MLKRNNNNRHQKFSRPQHRPNGGKSLAAQRNHLQQNFEKYLNLARDASGSGDKILAENYYQYAEHYLRTLNDVKAEEDRIQAQQQEQRQHHRPHPHQDQDKATLNDKGVEAHHHDTPLEHKDSSETHEMEAQKSFENSPKESLEFSNKGALNEGEKEGGEAPSPGVKRPRTRRPKPQKEETPTA